MFENKRYYALSKECTKSIPPKKMSDREEKELKVEPMEGEQPSALKLPAWAAQVKEKLETCGLKQEEIIFLGKCVAALVVILIVIIYLKRTLSKSSKTDESTKTDVATNPPRQISAPKHFKSL